MRAFRVYFQSADRLVEAQPGESLLELGQRVGVHIDSTCGGNGSCHQCRVRIHNGPYLSKMIQSDPARFMDSNGVPVSVHDEAEGEPIWLACRGRIMGDLVVEPAPRAVQGKTLVRKSLIGGTVEVNRPDLATDAMVAAVDLGSTTLAGYLIDLQTGEIVAQSSRASSQIPYGGDILTRVSHTERRPEGLKQLTTLAREDIDGILNVLAKRAGDRPIASVAICGNSVMQSLLLGWSVIELGRDPFEPLSLEPQLLTGSALDLSSVPDAEVYVLPIVAGFMGGDNAAAVLACGLDQYEGTALLIDIGTNGEIVVGGRDGLLGASTPTGPAFEGGQITWGMRASRGAIDSIAWEPSQVRTILTTIGNAAPVGICGSGIIACTWALRAASMCDRGGKLTENRLLRVGRDGVREILLVGPRSEAVTPEGNIRLAEREITFTQKDLREVQLAKSALRTGTDILLAKLGHEPERIIMAGGFGSYINIEAAVSLGLIPDLPREKIETAGNSAGLGAAMVAASLEARARAEKIARTIQHIPLPDEPDFQDRLIANIPYPV